MQLKICIKRSLAHILCSYAKKRCNFKQRSANNRQQTAQQARFRHSRLPGTYADRSLKGSRPLALSC